MYKFFMTYIKLNFIEEMLDSTNYPNERIINSIFKEKFNKFLRKGKDISNKLNDRNISPKTD